MEVRHTIKIGTTLFLVSKKKEGRNVLWTLSDGSEILGKDLRNIKVEVQCAECKNYFKIGLSHNLLQREQYYCQSCNQKGERNSFYNKTHTEETKKNHSECMTGRFVGEKNHFYNKHHTDEVRHYLSELNTGKLVGEKNGFYRKTHTEDTIEIIRQKNIECRQNMSDEDRILESEKLSKAQKILQQTDPEAYRRNKQKAARAAARSTKKYKMNNIEKILYEKLIKLGLNFKYSVILGFMQFDFGCKEKRILIEVHGDYWHGHPDIYIWSR